MDLIPRRAAAVAALFGTLIAMVASSAAWASEFPRGDEGYHSYTELTTEIGAVAALHPDIVTVFSIGKSFQGRDIWAAKVSDNVRIDEPEPEVLFDGGTHSDEHMSVEMTLHILHWLADGYGRDSRITNIVNNREIWIVFLVNPDGAEYDISGRLLPLVAEELTADARHPRDRHGPEPELRLSLGRRRAHERRPLRPDISRSIRLLGARDASDAHLPRQPRGQRPATDPGSHLIP